MPEVLKAAFAAGAVAAAAAAALLLLGEGARSAVSEGLLYALFALYPVFLLALLATFLAVILQPWLLAKGRKLAGTRAGKWAAVAPKVLKTLYAACMIIVLAVTLGEFYPHMPDNKDIGIFFGYAMLYLAFPVASLVLALAALLVWLAGLLHLSGLPSSGMAGGALYAALWLAVFVAGWWQWFIALPWLWRKWKARKA